MCIHSGIATTVVHSGWHRGYLLDDAHQRHRTAHKIGCQQSHNQPSLASPLGARLTLRIFRGSFFASKIIFIFRESPPGLFQHVLTVLIFWSWVLLLPRLPCWSRSLKLFPCASILLYGPLDIAWICCPKLPHHPCKNGTHSTCFYSTGGHTPIFSEVIFKDPPKIPFKTSTKKNSRGYFYFLRLFFASRGYFWKIASKKILREGSYDSTHFWEGSGEVFRGRVQGKGSGEGFWGRIPRRVLRRGACHGFTITKGFW